MEIYTVFLKYLIDNNYIRDKNNYTNNNNVINIISIINEDYIIDHWVIGMKCQKCNIWIMNYLYDIQNNNLNLIKPIKMVTVKFLF